MPGGTNLKAAGLFMYVWPFCYHQVLKGYGQCLDHGKTNLFES